MNGKQTTELALYTPAVRRLANLNRRMSILASAVERIWMEALEKRTLLSVSGAIDFLPTSVGVNLPPVHVMPVDIVSPVDTSVAATPLQTFDASSLVTNGVVSAAVVLPNGEILAAGTSTDPNDGSADITLALFNTDGTLDTTFGNGGVVTTNIGGDDASVQSVTVLSNGQFLVAGNDQEQGSFLLARYNADGSLDASFGTNGIVNAVAPASSDGFNNLDGVAVENDGSILAYGDDGTQSLLAHFNADGSLDTSFGNNGVASIMVDSTDSYEAPTSVAVNSDGSLLLNVSGADANGNAIAYDISLSSSGQQLGATAATPAAGASYTPLATLSDGSTLTNDTGGFALDQYAAGVTPTPHFRIEYSGINPGGPMDPVTVTQPATTPAPLQTFDASSTVTNGNVTAATVLPNGEILIAGTSTDASDGSSDITLALFNTDGSLDTSFGNGGVSTTNIGGDDASVQSVTVLPDGQILVAGNDQEQGSFLLARYNADGSLDSSFGTNGIVNAVAPASADGYNTLDAVTVESDGSILALGDDGTQNLIAHFNADGSLDTSFGTNGVVSTMADSTDSYEAPTAATVNADGSLLVNVAGADANGNAIAYNISLSSSGQQLGVTAATVAANVSYTPLATLSDGSTLAAGSGFSVNQYAAGVDPTATVPIVYTPGGGVVAGPTPVTVIMLDNTSGVAPLELGSVGPSDGGVTPVFATAGGSTGRVHHATGVASVVSVAKTAATDPNQYVRPLSAFANAASNPVDGFGNFLATSNPLASFSQAGHKPNDWIDSGQS